MRRGEGGQNPVCGVGLGGSRVVGTRDPARVLFVCCPALERSCVQDICVLSVVSYAIYFGVNVRFFAPRVANRPSLTFFLSGWFFRCLRLGNCPPGFYLRARSSVQPRRIPIRFFFFYGKEEEAEELGTPFISG